MTTPDEFIRFINGLPDPVVQLHDHGKARYRTIDLRTLTKDLPGHESLLAWWRGKNMPPHLSNTVAQTILELNPPENIRAAMLFLMM